MLRPLERPPKRPCLWIPFRAHPKPSSSSAEAVSGSCNTLEILQIAYIHGRRADRV